MSPIRHTRDGIVNNSLSKSILLTAIHKLIQEQNKETSSSFPELSYFPSFEYMMDDLR